MAKIARVAKHADPGQEDSETAAWAERMVRESHDRIKADQAELVKRGVIDEDGNLLVKELPPDMRPGSRTDLGSL